MQQHQLRPTTKTRPKRVGRGGSKGTYSGRGVKGQNARAGTSFQPLIRQWVKRYHKLRGYRNEKDSDLVTVNVRALQKAFGDGETVTPQTLKEKGALGNAKSRPGREVKILGDGELSKKLTVEGCSVSGAAKEKIEKAGGQVK